jgi:nitroreductase
MQQFAAAARNPARTPPLALMGWIPEGGRAPETGGPHAIRSRRIVSTAAVVASEMPRTTEATRLPKNPFAPVAQRRGLSTVAKEEEVAEDVTEDPSPVTNHPKAILSSSPSELSLAFQTMIRTRRPARQFRSLDDASSASYYDYEMALVRAIQSAYATVPSDHPPPFFFQRLLSAAAREQLATIVANVYFTAQLLAFQRLGQADALPDLQATAARKRDQWRRIPAVLVTLVTSSSAAAKDASQTPTPATETPQFAPLFDQDNVTYSDLQIYQPSSSSSPPRRRDDDDAVLAAAAATQNALLSLHAERYVTRQITGPLRHTPALAQLLRLAPAQRVVALVQVGQEVEADDLRGMEYFRHLHQRQQEEQRGRQKLWPELWQDF